jgi:HEAT repeat protein
LAALVLAALASCGQRAAERPLDEIVAGAEGGDAASLSALVAAFGHPDPDEAQKAWEAAVALGEAAEDALVNGLASDDPVVGEHAAGALGAIRSHKAVDALAAALRRPRFRRYSAAWALGEIGDPRGLPALVAALGDEDGETRKYATRSVVKFGPEAVPLLRELASGSAKGPQLRYAVRALGEIRDPATGDAVLAARGRVDDEIFLWAMGRLGDGRGLPYMKAAAASPHWRTRLAAVQALGDLGGREAEDVLRSRLEDEEWIVREWAARGLESITGERHTYRDQHGTDVYPYDLYR